MGQDLGQFSVLMSVYHRESKEHFEAAMRSVMDQTLQPDEVVLVKDGPLTSELDDVIASWDQAFVGRLNVIPLATNVGLGEALSIGLKACRHEMVARMDTDDICVKDRFEKQMCFLQRHPDIDLVGGWIAEFQASPTEPMVVRKVKEDPPDIVRACAYRNPLNHVTVMFRRSAVLKAGNYRSFHGMEDYDLWARMLANGSRFHNLQEVLVFVRIGAGMIERRGGINYFLRECRLQRVLLESGLVGKGQYAFNIAVRLVVRLAPVKLRESIYAWMLREGGGRMSSPA